MSHQPIKSVQVANTPEEALKGSAAPPPSLHNLELEL